MLKGYENMYLLPLAFIFSYWLIIRKTLNKHGISFFLAIYLAVSFLRYNILSLLVFKSSWYLGVSEYPPSPEQFNNAILLMIYEIFIYSFGIYFFHNWLIKNQFKKIIQFQKSNIIYWIFILLTCLIVGMSPNSLSFFSFITINSNYSSLDSLNTLSLIGIMFLSVARLLIYFIIIRWIVVKLKDKHYLLSFILVALVSLINSMIFIGANRASFLLNFSVTILVLLYLYRKLAISFVLIMVMVLPTLLGSLLAFRNTSTATDGANKLIDITNTLQVYLAGIYDVAIGLDIQTSNGGIFYMFLDILRSAIGPNLLVKNFDFINSVDLYNVRIFQSNLVSQIIPMISQGHLYLGTLLSPILGLIFIFIATYFTKLIIEKNRLELFFVFSLICGRLGFVMAQNGNIFMNELTTYLPLFLIVYYINNKVVQKNEENN
ncbi:hypothetical protein BUZ19_00365 [Staphylococcus haemolyticus]|nr:hypothetical protein [Staphylococcus sp. NWU MK-U1]PTK75373.1 hypothetical protein BUZ24_07260 [Staphylococcus haemolyticus]PTK98544.1 hypothetical protein BUZ19_00365 [Staphylococcus haemolyticus]